MRNSEKKIAKFKIWFEGLSSPEQLKTLACLMRLKKVGVIRNYEREIKRVIFTFEKKRGNGELLKVFGKADINEVIELSSAMFRIGRKIRGHVEAPRKSVTAGIGIGAAMVGAVGIYSARRRRNGIIYKKQ